MDFLFDILFLIFLVIVYRFYLNSIIRPIVILRRNVNGDYVIKNIGKGTAFNMIVVQREYGVKSQSAWEEVLRISVLEKGESTVLDRSEKMIGEDFGVMFSDLNEKNYFSTYVEGRIEIKKGRLVEKA